MLTPTNDLTDPTSPADEALAAWEAFAAQGLTVSVCCGPTIRQDGWIWSVTVLSRDGHQFDRPYAAHSFAHALEIAALEIGRRGWH